MTIRAYARISHRMYFHTNAEIPSSTKDETDHSCQRPTSELSAPMHSPPVLAPEPSQQQQQVGKEQEKPTPSYPKSNPGIETAVKKWSEYPTPLHQHSTHTITTQQRQKQKISFSQIINSSVSSTFFLRALGSFLFAVILSLLWDSSAVRPPTLRALSKQRYKLAQSLQHVRKQKGLRNTVASATSSLSGITYTTVLYELAYLASPSSEYSSFLIGMKNASPIAVIAILQLSIILCAMPVQWMLLHQPLQGASASSTSPDSGSTNGHTVRESSSSQQGMLGRSMSLSGTIMNVVHVVMPSFVHRLQLAMAVMNVIASIGDGACVYLVALSLYRILPVALS